MPVPCLLIFKSAAAVDSALGVSSSSWLTYFFLSVYVPTYMLTAGNLQFIISLFQSIFISPPSPPLTLSKLYFPFIFITSSSISFIFSTVTFYMISNIYWICLKIYFSILKTKDMLFFIIIINDVPIHFSTFMCQSGYDFICQLIFILLILLLYYLSTYVCVFLCLFLSGSRTCPFLFSSFSNMQLLLHLYLCIPSIQLSSSIEKKKKKKSQLSLECQTILKRMPLSLIASF